MKNHNYCPEFYATEISMISQPREIFPHGGKAPADHGPRVQTRPSFGHDVCLLSCPEAEVHRGQCLVRDCPQSQGCCQCQFSDQGLYSAGWQALRQKCLDFFSYRHKHCLLQEFTHSTITFRKSICSGEGQCQRTNIPLACEYKEVEQGCHCRHQPELVAHLRSASGEPGVPEASFLWEMRVRCWMAY